MRTFLIGTAAVMLLTAHALAADVGAPVTKAVAPLVRAWTWTGCFAGGHGGGLWTSKQDWIVRTPGGAFFGQSLGGHEAESVVGGVQGGCDYQFAGGFVVGMQGDYGWTDAVGRHDSARETGVAYHSRTQWIASVTGRAGYAWNRLLGYVRGGAAWERDEYWATTIVLGTAYRAGVTRAGWTVGAGVEYAFTDYLTGFVEYGYYDFGAQRIGLTPQVAGLRPASVDITATTSMVRAGLNLRFGP